MQCINIAVELKLQHDSHGAPQKVGVHAQPFRMHYVWGYIQPGHAGNSKKLHELWSVKPYSPLCSVVQDWLASLGD